MSDRGDVIDQVIKQQMQSKLDDGDIESIQLEDEEYQKKREQVAKQIAEAKLTFGTAYDEIIEIIEYYMDMPLDQIKFVAIWILGTYLHKAFSTYPFLFINAMRGSGKTRLLRLISHLAYHASGEVLTGVTESTLFRTPKHHTMIFDEFEGIGGKERAVFREYLNACYKSGGRVKRTRKVKGNGGEDYVIDTFEPFKPIAMANIWGMEEVLGDRCLSLILQKSNLSAKTKKLEDFETNSKITTLNFALRRAECSLCSVVTSQNTLKNWNNFINTLYTNNTNNIYYTNNTTVTKQIDTDEMFVIINNTEIEGRNLELLFPLFITARLINEDTFNEMINIGKKLVEQKREDELAESKDVMLIDFVANYFDGTLTFVPLTEIVKHFRAFVGTIEDSDDKWLNAKWLGRALKRLDLIIDKRRVARGNEVTLNVARAKEKIKMFKPVEGE